MADLALRVDRRVGRTRDHLIAAVGNHAHDEERQARAGGGLGNGVALHVDRERAGAGAKRTLGIARRDDGLAARARRITRREACPIARGGEPLAPGGLGREATAGRQDHGCGKEQVARRQIGRERAREPEAHEARRALRAKLPGHQARAFRIGAAADDAQSAGEVESGAVARGIAYLKAAPRQGGKWDEELYNAVGFPRVFYLRYHGYSAFFPLWALARHANLMRRNDRTVRHGM